LPQLQEAVHRGNDHTRIRERQDKVPEVWEGSGQTADHHLHGSNLKEELSSLSSWSSSPYNKKGLMSIPLLAASALIGFVVIGVGIYRAYTRGEFMLMVLGMLILMSCAANYLKRQRKEETPEDKSTEDRVNG
jgi:hypothetical protein